MRANEFHSQALAMLPEFHWKPTQLWQHQENTEYIRYLAVDLIVTLQLNQGKARTKGALFAMADHLINEANLVPIADTVRECIELMYIPQFLKTRKT